MFGNIQIYVQQEFSKKPIKLIEKNNNERTLLKEAPLDSLCLYYVVWKFYSDLSRIILFSIITLISTYEMWKLRKGKSMLFHFFYVWMLMLSIILELETLLFIFILTWTFDTFNLFIWKKIRKTKNHTFYIS